MNTDTTNNGARRVLWEVAKILLAIGTAIGIGNLIWASKSETEFIRARQDERTERIGRLEKQVDELEHEVHRSRGR